MAAVVDKKLVGLQRVLYGCCGVSLVVAPVLLGVQISILNAQSNWTYYIGSYEIDRALIIIIGVVSILLQFLGLYGAYKKSNWMCVAYGLAAGAVAGGSLVYSILYFLMGILLVIVLLVSGCIACYFARCIRLRKKRVQNPMVYTPGMPGQQNVVYQMGPTPGAQASYFIPGSGQPGVAMPGQPMSLPAGQMYAPPAPYHHGYPINVNNPGSPVGPYGEPALQPPAYTESPESSTAATASHVHTFGAPDPQLHQQFPGTIAPHKLMQ